MGEMLTRNSSMRQPTLTQMEFVQPTRKKPPLPSGSQRNTCEATGDSFYVHVASGRVAHKFDDMLVATRKKPPKHTVTPVCSKAESVGNNKYPVPDMAFSGVDDMYSTPRRPFKDGTSLKPIQLEDDEVSEALSDLTNTQMTKK